MALPIKKCSCRVMKRNEFPRGALNIINLWCEGIQLYHSNMKRLTLAVVSTDDRYQFQCLKTVINKKTGPFF